MTSRGRMRGPLFLDLAIYGISQHGGKNHHRLMEEKLREIGGVKTLIAHNYYGEDEFWSLWNKPNYDAVKAVTDPNNAFRNLYVKTCQTAMGISEVTIVVTLRGGSVYTHGVANAGTLSTATICAVSPSTI